MNTLNQYRKSKLKISSFLCAAMLMTVSGGAPKVLGLDASISHTGPHSRNQIRSDKNIDCSIVNTNKVDADVVVNQNAQSGDAALSNQGSSNDWGEWDPAVWAQKGYTYEQWNAAFQAHLKSESEHYRKNWGSAGSTRHSSSASTGNASNTNTTAMNVGIDNGSDGYCLEEDSDSHTHTKPPRSHHEVNEQGEVMGDNTHNSTSHLDTLTGLGSGKAGEGLRLELNGAQVSGYSTNVPRKHDQTGQGGNGGDNTHGHNSESSSHDGDMITNTGPQSHNAIEHESNHTVNIQNKTTATFTVAANQQAKSGDVFSSGNTEGNNSGSGNVQNGNDAGIAGSVDN